MTQSIHDKLAAEFQITSEQAAQLAKLLDQDFAVPFVAQFKKESVGGLSENKIHKFQKRHRDLVSLEEKKTKTIQFFTDNGKLTDELKNAIETCISKTEVNDIYLPHQQNKQSKAQIAIQHGLKPLAQMILDQKPLPQPFESMATDFTSHVPEFSSIQQVLDGVRAIVCEVIAEDFEIKRQLREMYFATGMLNCKPTAKALESKNVYTEFYDLHAPARTLVGTRYLAIQRGERQKFLSTQIEINNDEAIDLIKKRYATSTDDALRFLMESLVSDSYNNFITVQFQHEIKQRLWEASQESAMQSYLTSYRQQLLQAPLPPHKLFAIYPGEEAGCGCVCVDVNLTKLDACTLFIHDDRKTDATEQLLNSLRTHQPDAIVLGISVFQKQAQAYLREVLQTNSIHIPIITLSAQEALKFVESDKAKPLFTIADYAPVNAAYYLAHKLVKPLETLAHVDPLTLALGSYQKDVDQQQLSKRLVTVFQSVLCRIGVDPNKADASLLSHVPGLDSEVALKIKAHIEANGALQTIADFNAIDGVSDVAKEQCAVVLNLKDTPHKKDTRPQMELLKPDPKIQKISDLVQGQSYKARLTHFAAYGIFADLGLDSDILIHRNSLPEDLKMSYANKLKIGQTLELKVVGVDAESNRAQFELIPRAAFRKTFRERPTTERRFQRDDRNERRPSRSHDRQNDRHDKRDRRDSNRHGGGNKPRKQQFGTLGDQFKAMFNKE